MTTATVGVARLYRARAGEVTVVDVPELLFASVDGQGAPGDAAFGAAVSGLYAVGYGVRFARRGRPGAEKVSPLEALWWTADPAAAFAEATAAGGFTAEDMAGWSWRAILRLPSDVDDALVGSVKATATRRHPEQRAVLDAVRVAPWREGLCVQTLHLGPYRTEPVTVRLMHDFLGDHGYRPVGRHHEVYLSDPSRCDPARLRTILRQPVARWDEP